MFRPIVPKAIITLLLLIMVIQPVLALGQFAKDTAETHTHLCDMACGDMTPADCAVAANQGSCGTAPCVLVSETEYVQVQSPSKLFRLPPHEGYLSIILDTLTPPPNSSKA